MRVIKFLQSCTFPTAPHPVWDGQAGHWHMRPPSIDRKLFCSEVQAAAVASPTGRSPLGMVIDTNPGPIKVGCAAGNSRQVSWARGGGALAPHPAPGPGALFRPGRKSLAVLVMPHGLSLGRRSHGIAAPCPEGRPRCGPQSGGQHRSQSRSHPAQMEGREGTCTSGTWTRFPGLGPNTHPDTGSSQHWLLYSCSFSCPLRKAPFSAFTRSALVGSVTWGGCPASSGPQPSNLCNGAGEHWRFSGKSPRSSAWLPCVLALS